MTATSGVSSGAATNVNNLNNAAIDSAAAAVADVMQAIINQQQTVIAAQATLSQALRSLAEAQMRLSDAQSALAAWKPQYDEDGKLTNGAEREQLRAAVDQAQSDVRRAESAVDRAESQLEQAKRTLEQLEHRKTELEQRLQQIQQQAAESQRQAEQQRKRLEESERQARLNGDTNQLAAIQRAKAQLAAQQVDLTRVSESASSALKTLRTASAGKDGFERGSTGPQERSAAPKPAVDDSAIRSAMAAVNTMNPPVARRPSFVDEGLWNQLMALPDDKREALLADLTVAQTAAEGRLA